MGVKKKTSEYQRAFKSVYPLFTATYEKNVDYRTRRRLTEHDHQVDPFDWDPASETDSDLGIINGERKPKRSPDVPRHVYKHEKFNKSYRDRLSQITQQLATGIGISAPADQQDGKDEEDVPLSARSRDSGAQTDQIVQVDRAVNGTVQVYPRGTSSQETDSPKKEASPCLIHGKAAASKPQKAVTSSPVKPRRPVYKPTPSKHTPSPRSSSAPLTRPAKQDTGKPQPQQTGKRAPFVSYGCRDDEFNTAEKLTYNVRASAQIHPSALNAQKRRQVASKKRTELSKSASLAEQKKRAYYNEFNARVKRETADWATEYRSHYAGYDRGVYEQNISSRPVSRVHDPQLLLTTW